LIPFSKGVSELLPEVEYALTDKSATVKEKGGRIERFIGLMIFLCVRYSDVLMCSLYEFVPQLFFELRSSSISVNVFEIFVELKLIEFLFLELFESVLD
jgi:hypothetical protein